MARVVVALSVAVALSLASGRGRAEEPAPLRAGEASALWVDGSATVTSWDRVRGVSDGPDVVPALRTRVAYRPVPSVPFEVYAGAQVTREVFPRGVVGLALPKVDVDDYAILAIGGRARIGSWLELFAQAGPALNLLPRGERVAYDVRWGAVLDTGTRGCAPAPVHGVTAALSPCLEARAEVTYATRLDNDVIGYARPRAGVGYLVTGPVAWQALAEARVAKDVSNDYWNNFGDAGVGQRWRLLAPFRFDLLVTANAGSYFGVWNHTPAPSRLAYDDVRALAALVYP